MKELLIKHYHLYPKSQIQDMIKLIYQNEFAGGHMINDERESFKRLCEEVHHIKKIGMEKEIFEEIGNDLFRIHLHSIENIKLSTINQFFVISANTIKGSIESYLEKLNVLRKCITHKELPFSIDKYENYIKEYKKIGYPPVRHSEVYRNTYFPSYRVIKTQYKNYYDVFLKIDSLMKVKDKIIVAIDGNCGAGKSELAALLNDVYDCNVFHMDDFFLTPDLRTELRLKEIGGNVDYLRFKHEVLSCIKNNQNFKYRKYNCKDGSFIDSEIIKPKRLNIIEGSYSMHKTLINDYDLKIFMQLNRVEQRNRIQKRNGKEMLNRFINEWIHLEDTYFKTYNLNEKCDLVYHDNKIRSNHYGYFKTQS